jgi:hypothetical protein
MVFVSKVATPIVSPDAEKAIAFNVSSFFATDGALDTNRAPS